MVRLESCISSCVLTTITFILFSLKYMEEHIRLLEALCRICGRFIKGKERKEEVVKHAEEIQKIWKVSVLVRSPNVHPRFICMKCRVKCSNKDYLEGKFESSQIPGSYGHMTYKQPKSSYHIINLHLFINSDWPFLWKNYQTFLYTFSAFSLVVNHWVKIKIIQSNLDCWWIKLEDIPPAHMFCNTDLNVCCFFFRLKKKKCNEMKSMDDLLFFSVFCFN